MKIGILTFHYSINPGSVLQVYCSYKLLKAKFPESRVEIINIVPYNREINNWNFVNFRFPFIKIHSIKRYSLLRKFIKEHTNLSKRVYFKSQKSQIDYINQQNYDLIFTGSDTIWMHSQKFDEELPTIYFLPNEIKAKKISIAASVDPLKNEAPYISNKEILKSIFDDYEMITVRDDITENILNKIGVNKAKKIADPTILYDFEKDFSINIKKSNIINKQKALIWISDSKIESLIKKELSKLSEIEFVERSYCTSGDVVNDLNKYSELDLVVTDRFHRSIFSLKLSNALVINVERENKNPIKASKGRDLLESIGISEYCIRYASKSKNLFLKSLSDLFLNYDSNEFQKREKLLQRYISNNKEKWDDLINSIE